MEIQPNFEYLCRVCAANTKGKNSVAECVYIFKTPSLKDKIEKYLYLSISEDDALPKVLCKTCFRQVEATASLSKIAKHTQKVFGDFLFSIKPKPSTGITYDNDINESEYTPISLTCKEVDKTITSPPPPPLTQTQSQASVQNSALNSAGTTPQKEEVVVNVSVNDPLTRETQQKMISASQKRQSTSLDARFTPKSIAQRAFTGPAKVNENLNAATGISTKKQSPPGVINFIHGRPQQVTTFSSGGYVIGGTPTTSSTGTNNNTASNITTGNATNRNSLESNTIMQQKRKNLHRALNSIKASNTGQVSLLKASQKIAVQASPSQQPPPQQPPPPPAKPKAKSSSVQALLNQDVIEELPDKIIIASAKSSKKAATKKSVEAPASKTVKSAPVSEPETTPVQQKQQLQPPQPSITEDITLGKVIKDIDLLKLILKALKWPVDRNNMDMLMIRLRNSKFTDIMSDPNLLQDTDLTQLLGPYLAPVLLAAKALQHQQQQIANAAAAAAVIAASSSVAVTQPPPVSTTKKTKTSTTDLQNLSLANAIPYKLPAETSVQLVPASPEAEDTTKSTLKRDGRSVLKSASGKRARKTTKKTRDSSSIVISDEEGTNNASTSSAAAASTPSARSNANTAPNFNVDIDPAFLTQFGLFASAMENPNEALLSMLQRQHAVINRQQRAKRRRRSSSYITVPASGGSMDLDFDTDDIVLMEPGTLDNTTTTTTQSHVEAAINATATGTGNINSFLLPPPAPLPPITRPIIKRRKTVIQTSSSVRANVVTTTTVPASISTTATAPAETITTTTSSIEATTSTSNTNTTASKAQPIVPPLQKKTTETATSVISNAPQQSPTTTTVNEKTATVAATSSTASTANPSVAAPVSVAATTSPARSGYTKKAHASKSALGQQLLEAIGIPKVGSSYGSECNKSATETTTPRDSVQQIRSALKMSLKKAQEQQRKQQQQRKQEETVIQDADSTTKNIVKEMLVESKTKNSSSSDIEDQIDKITLVVQNKADAKKANKVEETATDENDKNKQAGSGRRKAGAGINKNQRQRSLLLQNNKETVEINDDEDDDVEVKEVKEKIKNDKDEGEILSISTSSAADTSASKESPGVTPRKRGRKRKEDNALEKDKKEQDDVNEENETASVRGRSAARKAGADFDKDSDTASVKNDDESDVSTPRRPTRVSKQMSRYYKGPDKRATSRRSILTRSTRNRN